MKLVNPVKDLYTLLQVLAVYIVCCLFWRFVLAEKLDGNVSLFLAENRAFHQNAVAHVYQGIPADTQNLKQLGTGAWSKRAQSRLIESISENGSSEYFLVVPTIIQFQQQLFINQ